MVLRGFRGRAYRLSNATFYQSTLWKLYFHFLLNWMGYDHGDRFPFDFLNQMEIDLCLKSKGKLSPRLYPFQYGRKWKQSFLSACPGKTLLLKPLGTILCGDVSRGFRGCFWLGSHDCLDTPVSRTIAVRLIVMQILSKKKRSRMRDRYAKKKCFLLVSPLTNIIMYNFANSWGDHFPTCESQLSNFYKTKLLLFSCKNCTVLGKNPPDKIPPEKIPPKKIYI